MTTSTPENLKYTSSHEWVREEDDDVITVGITEHAQSLLGDVVFVELPEIGRTVETSEACAVIESVKAAADVYAPVPGEVIAINDELEGTPELVNSEPYEGGWLYQLKVSDKAALTDLMTAEAYQASIEEE
jgi:glycine cleavage system H protein